MTDEILATIIVAAVLAGIFWQWLVPLASAAIHGLLIAAAWGIPVLLLQFFGFSAPTAFLVTGLILFIIARFRSRSRGADIGL